jgi:phosphoribosylformylglycinamidine cyclo-ligase
LDNTRAGADIDRSERQDDGTLSYRSAGVDIDAADAVVAGIRGLAARTHSDRVPKGLGHFGGFFRIGPAGSGATLVASIDGVGTKLKVASLAGRHEGIGADIVNHCLNDIAACGATPLFFLDYFGTGRLQPDVAVTVIGGIAAACEAAGVALIGGETAEMPGVYSGDDYDLVGTIVGMVESDAIVDGSKIASGHVLVGIPSSGFHTNGYSLIRAALGLNESDATRERLAAPAPFEDSRTLAEVLLEPHRSYLPVVRRLLTETRIAGMAHITGGGLPGNVSRIIPDGLAARIETAAWQVPAAFSYVAEAGNVSTSECYRAFNMGVGYVVVCSPDDVPAVTRIAAESVVIGEITLAEDERRVVLVQDGAELQ